MRSKAKNKQPEHLEQIQVIEWARAREEAGDLPGIEMLYAVPNGGRRHARTAVAMKREGVRKGVPDLCLAACRGGYFGMYLEMKAGKNTLSKEQKEFSDGLTKNNYKVVVCWKADDAIRELFRYLQGEITIAGYL